MTQSRGEYHEEPPEPPQPNYATIVGLGIAGVGGAIEIVGFVDHNSLASYGGWFVLAIGLTVYVKDEVLSHWRNRP
jgi:hypothetical protein